MVTRILNRRHFLKNTGLGFMGMGIANLGVSANQAKHRLGHTGITWGYAPQNVEKAIVDVASLGYQGFESFGSVLEYWESQGGLSMQLVTANLPLVAAYCPMILTDPNKRKEEVQKIVRWGKLIKKYGAKVAVIGPDNVDRTSYYFTERKEDIITSLNDMAMALDDIGIVGALHQHTGSCISTRDELYGVMEMVNTKYLKLCPDTGELLSAGLDPVQVVKDFLPVVAHVHMKDYNGGSSNDGYCPAGSGQVDMAGVNAVLETSDADFMIMVELNPDSGSSSPSALELARTSKNYFEKLGYS